MMLSVGVCLKSNDVLAAEKKESDSYGYSWNWSDNVDNYVFERDDGGLTTVEHFKSLDANYNAKDYITVHEYAGTSKSDKEFSISMELSSWGGFFHGENYNFFVFGQSNTDQNDKKEVVRIVKYSHNWTRLGSCSVYGANTSVPFEAGSLRMDEQDGILYIATCHQMYGAADGLRHQASMNFIIDESTMKMIDDLHLVESGVYSSHSFNQFIQVSGDYVYRIDHGDAYPRGIKFTRTDVYDPEFDYESAKDWERDPDTGDYTYTQASRPINKNIKSKILMEFPGKTGQNYTGCEIGGFEMAGDRAVVVGTSIDYSKGIDSNSATNIFVVTGTIDGTPVVKYLTSYKDPNTQPLLGAPQLVKVSDDKFVVIWDEGHYEEYEVEVYDPYWDYTWTDTYSTLVTTTKYVAIDSTGKTISDYYTLDTQVTDCKPVLCSDGVIRWFYNARLDKKVYDSPVYTHKAEINADTLKGSDGITYKFDYENALNLTDETGVGGFIERLYSVTLGRESDASGKTYWTNRVKKEGGTGAELAMNFLGSQEFANKKLSDVDFVCALYATFFGRQHDEGGLQHWLNQLANGASRGDVIWGFISSKEFANICLTYGIPSGTDVAPTITIEANDDIKGFAERLYTKCLNRESDKKGLEYWAAELANMRKSGSVVARDFFFSEEFIGFKTTNEEYVTRLYRTFMDREPEKAGFDYWLGELKAGRMTREDVFDGFASSAEWADICADYGILK